MPNGEPIFNIQISHAVSGQGNPIGITQSFSPQQVVYLTFEKEPDESGQRLFVKTKWHKDDIMCDETILDLESHSKYGYISRKYDTPSKGKLDVYVCSDETCADERHIAQIQFTIEDV